MKLKLDGYLTVFLSLSLTLLLSIFFVLIRGAFTNYSKMKLECVTDIGINAVLGEFQSIRLNQPKFTQGNDFLILDMEHAKTVPNEDFVMDYIESSLRSLHDEMDSLFFKTIPTEEALAIWGKEGES